MKVGVSTETLAPMRSPLAPPAQPRVLPVVPCDPTPTISPPVDAAAVRTPTDRFRCEPYSAVLFARECVRRQEAAAMMGPRVGRGSEAMKLHRMGDYYHCRACPVGDSIRKRLSS